MFAKLKQNKEAKKLQKEQEAKVQALRKFVKEHFYPLLVKDSKSVSDAIMFCQAVSMAIKNELNKTAEKYVVNDLGIIPQLDKKNEEYQRFLECFQAISELKVRDALSVVEGMGQAINACVQKEQSGRKINELNGLTQDFE